MMPARTTWLAAAMLLALADVATTQTPQVLEDAQLTGPESSDDAFARSVAISGELALVGAAGNDAKGIDAGAVSAFRRVGTTWTREADLLASDGHAYENFGCSVAVAGNVALVGAPGDEGGGAAYVFRRGDSGWLEEQKIEPSDGVTNGVFGRAVALFGDRVLVGAPGDDEQGAFTGAAYVFRLDAAGWVEEAKLLASDGAAGDAFGSSCGLGADTAIVSSGWPGSACVFRRNGTIWTVEQEIVPSDGDDDDFFGSAVALRGDLALVGAPLDDDLAVNSGAAYVFRHDGARWVEEQKLLASDGAFVDWFGDAVALGDDVALVGAWLAGPTSPIIEYGAAYVFRWNGSAWVETLKPTPSDAAPEGGFGKSVALSSEHALVGALPFSDVGQKSGSAYVYTLPTPWSSLGGGLPGSGGEAPRLAGLGTLTPGSTNQLALSGAFAGTTTNVVLGASQVTTPFKGGVLVPSPDVVVTGLAVDAGGMSTIPFTWPLGVPAGTTIVLQHWVVDPGGPAGFAASNGVLGEAP